MHVTLDVSNAFVALAQVRGQTPEAYAQQLVYEDARSLKLTAASVEERMADSELFFRKTRDGSNASSLVPNDAFKRENLSQDRD